MELCVDGIYPTGVGEWPGIGHRRGICVGLSSGYLLGGLWGGGGGLF